MYCTRHVHSSRRLPAAAAHLARAELDTLHADRGEHRLHQARRQLQVLAAALGLGRGKGRAAQGSMVRQLQGVCLHADKGTLELLMVVRPNFNHHRASQTALRMPDCMV